MKNNPCTIHLGGLLFSSLFKQFYIGQFVLASPLHRLWFMEGFFITATLKIFLAKIKLAIYYANMAYKNKIYYLGYSRLAILLYAKQPLIIAGLVLSY